jgi:ubiquitin-like protein Nedd8
LQIKIKSLTGVLYKIDCEETDTTFNLKEKLREKLGVEPEQLQLVFGGRVMGDDKTVGELAIKAGAVIHAVLNLRGGAP